MVTDDERREVAERLRGISRDVKFWEGVDPLHYVKKGVFGDVDRHGPNETIDRLADLIEPTCDRDALLALADEIEYGASSDDGEYHDLPATMVAAVARKQMEYARRIREALGVSDD